jgi:hypothetical protein
MQRLTCNAGCVSKSANAGITVWLHLNRCRLELEKKNAKIEFVDGRV